MKSDVSGFHKKSVEERRKTVVNETKLSPEDEKNLEKPLDMKTADLMIENAIGIYGLPLGIATNFVINGKELLIPMCIEESSVVAGASKAAKLARDGGGFKAEAPKEELVAGQVQLINIKDFEKAKERVMKEKGKLLKMANPEDSVIVRLGGGMKDIELREVNGKNGKMLIAHILVDVKDAMGANTVNTIVESLAPELEKLSGGRAVAKIISNLADRRVFRAKAVWKKETIGEEAVDGVLNMYYFAEADPYRAATHNKGIMNGIDAVVTATGNDFRANEAGAHAYAARNGRYTSLTRYYKNKDGDLVGEIEIPLQLGIVGGVTKVHPLAKLSLKILGVKTAKELGEIIASVGLAQNFAAIYAIATKGIQEGHMRLHAKNLAVQAGAKDAEIDFVANEIIKRENIKEEEARKVLEEMRR